jgi:hypothetical protein
MITCDKCQKQILGVDRVHIPTKQDPYGELTDWCKECADELNDVLCKVRRKSKLQLEIDIKIVMDKWKLV